MITITDTAEDGRPEAAASGDWLEAHADYLFNFALGQVRDAGVAEDLVQETFLAALRSRDRFAGRSSDRTWLVGILRHKIHDHLRRRCRERAVLADSRSPEGGQERWDEAVAWVHDVAAECMTPARRMELAEFRAGLERAMGELPPRLAQAFRLYEIEERSNGEVCEAMQISEGNLWVMLHRARRQLRDRLAAWWRGDFRSDRSAAPNP